MQELVRGVFLNFSLEWHLDKTFNENFVVNGVLYDGQKRFCIYIKRDIAGIICEKKNLEARNYYGYINLVP